MKKTIVMSIALLAANLAATAHAENYFGVEGTRWTVETSSFITEEPMISYRVYSLEGKATVSGHECLKYLRDGKLAYYVFTEGDKVYCIRPDKEDEILLIYDFGMEVGDVATFDIPSAWSYNTQRCEEITLLTSCGHTYEQMRMCDLGSSMQDEWGQGLWLKGIGGITLFFGDFANWDYDAIGVSSYLTTVEVNGEIIYDANDTTVSIQNVIQSTPDNAYRLDGTPQTQPTHGLSIRNGKVEFHR